MPCELSIMLDVTLALRFTCSFARRFIRLTYRDITNAKIGKIATVIVDM